MDIPIGDYHLSSDSHNFIISKPPKLDNRGVKFYPEPSYYANPAQAIEGLLKTRLRKSEATTLTELLNEFRKYTVELSEVFDANFGGK